MTDEQNEEAHYVVTIKVGVVDKEKLLAKAREAALRNGFDTVADYDEARTNSDDPVRYDILEVWPELPNADGFGLFVGDMDADED